MVLPSLLLPSDRPSHRPSAAGQRLTRQAWIAAGLIGLSLSVLATAKADGAGFGRWESRLRQCSLEAASRPERSCAHLRLEQPVAGLLSVRFVGPGSRERPGSEEVVFAGDLHALQPPLSCDAEGRCQAPRTPLRVRVRMVAWAGFDDRGLVETLPQSRLAQGECLIERMQVRCDADLKGGSSTGGAPTGPRRWTAQGQLPP